VTIIVRQIRKTGAEQGSIVRVESVDDGPDVLCEREREGGGRIVDHCEQIVSRVIS
jgi:hypothetical protein